MGHLWKHGFGHIFTPFHNVLCVVTFPHHLLYHKNIIFFPWGASKYPFLTHHLHVFLTSDENHWRPDCCPVQTPRHTMSRDTWSELGQEQTAAISRLHVHTTSQPASKHGNQGDSMKCYMSSSQIHLYSTLNTLQYPFLTHDLHMFHTSDENHWRPIGCPVQTPTHTMSRDAWSELSQELKAAISRLHVHTTSQPASKRGNQGTPWNVICHHHKFIYIVH